MVFLRITLEDHLETEEAPVVPFMRQQMTEAELLSMAKTLLLDESAREPRWTIDWINQHLNMGKQGGVLAKLETRL